MNNSEAVGVLNESWLHSAETLQEAAAVLLSAVKSAEMDKRSAQKRERDSNRRLSAANKRLSASSERMAAIEISSETAERVAGFIEHSLNIYKRSMPPDDMHPADYMAFAVLDVALDALRGKSVLLKFSKIKFLAPPKIPSHDPGTSERISDSLRVLRDWESRYAKCGEIPYFTPVQVHQAIAGLQSALERIDAREATTLKLRSSLTSIPSPLPTRANSEIED